MMSAYANSVQKPERFDTYVRKFRSICMMHGVKIGSRRELSAFLPKLAEDRHLAMDFWAFVSKASNREGGELSDDQMLGVVVEGITENEISEIDGGAQRTVEDLRAMLAGVDIHGSEQGRVEMAPFPRSEAGPQRNENQRNEKQILAQAEELAARPADSPTPPTTGDAGSLRNEDYRWTHAEELPAGPSNSQESLAPEKPNAGPHHAATLPATPPPQLDETLLRLELTRLVQQYFDNIDKRISKLEPQADGTGSPQTSSQTRATGENRQSPEEPISAEELEELRLRRMAKTRLVLEPAPSPVEGSLSASKEDDVVPMHVPLEHYSSPAGFNKAALLLVVLLIGLAFAIYRDPTPFRKGFALVVAQLHSVRAAMSPDRGAPPSTSSGEPTSATTEQSQPATAQPLEGTSTPPPVNTPDRTASVRSQAATNGPDASSSGSTTTNRALVPTDQAPSNGISSFETAGAVNVNPDVMDENLIVQRVPAYPEVAKQHGVAGDVVMQALISKEGTVKRVHVVEGDSRLRSAAEEAVYKWRYRPYVLHGQPVEVATTVTVNFNLDR
jgi:TonB family protein